jgi:putative CRISPR-associated protein (TIGR02620 family)
MTRWFVSRHSGAVEWAKRRGIAIDRQVAHLNAAEVSAGDVVMGTLPFDAAAEVCRRGAGFYALILALREEQRGRDLSADDLEAAKARLQQYDIQPVEEAAMPDREPDFDVHVCLISAQLAPNFTPLLDERFAPKQKRVLMVVSPEMRKKADCFAEVCKSKGLTAEELLIKDQFNYGKIRCQLAEWLQKQENEPRIVLNVTGGTKIMAMAAQAAFAADQRPLLYVTDNDNSALLITDAGKADTGSPPTVKLADKLNMRDYFRLYGYEMSTQGTLLNLLEFTKELTDNAGKYKAALNELHEITRDTKNILNFSFESNNSGLPDLLDLCSRFGLLSRQETEFKFSNKESKKYVRGGWLEEHVFETLCSLPNDCAIQDKACNVSIAKTNSINRPPNDMARNELDVAFMAGNQLHIIECKSGRLSGESGGDALYKVEAIAKQTGIKTKTMLISYQDIGPAHRLRAELYGTKVVQNDELPDLETQLRKWITGQ